MHTVYTIFLLALLVGGSLSVQGQSDAVTLPEIEFRDKVLERNLNAFAGQNREKIIEISVSTQDSVHVYTITGVYMLQTLESLVRVRYVTWGQWYGRTIVFSGDSTLSQHCTVTRPASVDRLIDYAQGPLKQKRVTEKQRQIWTASGLVAELKETVTVCNAPVWQFGVKNNREEWFSIRGGYDSRDIIMPGTFR